MGGSEQFAGLVVMVVVVVVMLMQDCNESEMTSGEIRSQRAESASVLHLPNEEGVEVAPYLTQKFKVGREAF